MAPKMLRKSSFCEGGLREGLRARFWSPQEGPQRLPRAPGEPQERPKTPKVSPRRPKVNPRRPQTSPRRPKRGPKRVRGPILDPPDVVFDDFRQIFIGFTQGRHRKEVTETLSHLKPPA